MRATVAQAGLALGALTIGLMGANVHPVGAATPDNSATAVSFPTPAQMKLGDAWQKSPTQECDPVPNVECVFWDSLDAQRGYDAGSSRTDSVKATATGIAQKIEQIRGNSEVVSSRVKRVVKKTKKGKYIQHIVSMTADEEGKILHERVYLVQHKKKASMLGYRIYETPIGQSIRNAFWLAHARELVK